MRSSCQWIVGLGVLVAALLVGGCSGITALDGNDNDVAVALRILPNQVVTGFWSQGTFTVTPQTLLAEGGAPSAGYTWAQPTGSTMRVPFGCTVAPFTGVFQGSGGQLVGAGTHPFQIQVSDGTRTATGIITLQVNNVEILPDAVFQQFMGMGTWRLADATANQPYGASLGALGGEPPYSWSEDTSYEGRGDFALSGLVIDQARGIVRGTVNNSAAGKTLRFRVVVRDNTGAIAVSDGLTYEIVVK